MHEGHLGRYEPSSPVTKELQKAKMSICHYQVFTLELVLKNWEATKLPAKLKGRQDGVLAGEGDQGRAGQCPVSIDPGSGVP